MVQIISDSERIERMKVEIRKFVETNFPFKRIFSAYGIAAKQPEKQEEVVIATNQAIGAVIKATVNESGLVEGEKILEPNVVVELEKNVETKAEKKRHNKGFKVRTGKGGAVHLHRA
jgi:hypothetical protein